MKILNMCLNWKVLVGLAVVGIAVFVINPHLALGVLPLLLLAVCPLSMLFMMKSMGGGQQATVNGQYTCPMHPEVRSDQPGRCPRCGMELVPTAPQRAAPAVGTQEDRVMHLQAQLQSLKAEQAALEREVEQLEMDAGSRADGRA